MDHDELPEPEMRSLPRCTPKVVIWGLVIALFAVAAILFGLRGITAATPSGPTIVPTGTRWAKYEPIQTPGTILRSNRQSIQLAADSLSAFVTSVRTSSKSIVEDANGKQIGGGEDNRETESEATALLPRWPFFATITSYGWGTPQDSYRLDVEFNSPTSFIDYRNTTASKGLSVEEVSADREHVALLFSGVLAASDLDEVYDASELAHTANVVTGWQGNGVVSVAVKLPPTKRVAKPGSLTMTLGKDWQIEGFSVWTDDTFAYEDASNPQSSEGEIPIPELLIP